VHFEQSTHYIKLQNTVQAPKVLSFNFVKYFLVLNLIHKLWLGYSTQHPPNISDPFCWKVISIILLAGASTAVLEVPVFSGFLCIKRLIFESLLKRVSSKRQSTSKMEVIIEPSDRILPFNERISKVKRPSPFSGKCTGEETSCSWNK